MRRLPRRSTRAAVAALAVSFLSSSPAVGSQSARRPNIVVIMTDDQGYGDLGITGNAIIDTPRIDALARESASLRYFYVSPVCAPTRASLMTGRYNYRTRAIDTWVGRAMMEPAEVTIAEILRDAGYRTGIFGKWHLGDCYPMRAIDQGFDEALVHLGGGLAQPSEPLENDRRYTDPVLFHNGEKVETKGYCTDVYFDAALEFVSASAAREKPFFAYIPTNAPHGPFHDVPPGLHEKYQKRDVASLLGPNKKSVDRVARIFAMIDNIDTNVGRLLDELDRLGITKDTIVVYLHDNGPQTARYVGDMRGTKGQVYEGGVRTPLFVRWPARLRAGTTSDRVGAHIDILPTLLDAAGVSVPVGLRLDGRSLLPLLEGKEFDWPERTIFIQAHRGDAPLRYHHFAARGPRWKLLRASGFGRQQPPAGQPFELYDLQNDPRESHDRAAEQPEIVARMKAEYDRWFDDVSSTRPDNYAKPRIIVGTDHETVTFLTQQDWHRLSGQGWGASGEWLLRFVGEREYDVRVQTRADVASARVHLRIGDRTKSVEVPGPTRSIAISQIRVPAGEASLQVAIEMDGPVVAPYHVFVSRR